MIRGIRLVGLAAERDRILISPGTVTARRLRLSGYQSGAIVPVPTWRPITEEEYRLLTGADESTAQVVVCAFRPICLPADISRTLAQRSFGCQFHLREGRVQRVGSDFLLLAAYFAEHYGAGNEVVPLGSLMGKAGQLTTTRDATDGLRTGLHVDSWFRLSLEERYRAPNRLCLNLGREARQLLIVNLTLNQMERVLRDRYGAPALSELNPTTLGRLFLSCVPDYGIISIRIEPGEAYIAPTEYIIHDASSLVMTSPDITFTLLGRFSVRDEWHEKCRP